MADFLDKRAFLAMRDLSLNVPEDP